MVKVFQVPKELFKYPAVADEIRELFLSGATSTEGAEKTEQYRQRALARGEQRNYPSQEEYLRSLGVTVTIERNALRNVPRIAELTQKSNQFNLTTRRYSEAEVEALMAAPGAAVYALHVRDRFGDSGLTGIVVSRFVGSDLVIDSFLMSCRVIGRDIEMAFWDRVIQDGVAKGCTAISAEFIRSRKNGQVEDFFDRLGLTRVGESADHRRYRSDIASLALARPPHVEVRDAL
jgi:FkbH-like protein